MLSKKEIKDIQSLSHKKHRKEQGCYLAEGPKVVTELCSLLPQSIQKVYALPAFISLHPELPAEKLLEIDLPTLEKISALTTPNEVVAVFKQKSNEPPVGKGWKIYLDTIQDPGNLGTIIRIADWFGVEAVVMSPGCAEVYSPKVVQATMASIARVHLYIDERETWLQQQQLPVYAAALDGQSLYECSNIEPGVLLIGNEANGIRPAYLDAADQKITIPRIGGAESLNAAVASGILLSHLVN